MLEGDTRRSDLLEDVEVERTKVKKVSGEKAREGAENVRELARVLPSSTDLSLEMEKRDLVLRNEG